MTKKFNIWDSSTIQNYLMYLKQIEAKIEELAKETETEMARLPPSVVPTEFLYEMAVCYGAMYQLLEKQDLIKSGNPALHNPYQ